MIPDARTLLPPNIYADELPNARRHIGSDETGPGGVKQFHLGLAGTGRPLSRKIDPK